MKGQPRSN